MSSLLRTLWTLGQGGLQLIYPNVCWVCEEALPIDAADVCPECFEELTQDPSCTCPRCASTIGLYTNVREGCPSCRGTSLAFDRAIRLAPYAGLLREVILRMKHQSGEGLAEIVGRLWASVQRERLAELQADGVVPVPLHWWRRLTRGYNQAETLALAVARQLKLPCWPRILSRVRYTPRQTAQPSPQRRQDNVRGAFRARRGVNLKGKRFLLVDDVMTTGATGSEAARALRQAGAASVVLAVLAHGRI